MAPPDWASAAEWAAAKTATAKPHLKAHRTKRLRTATPRSARGCCVPIAIIGVSSADRLARRFSNASTSRPTLYRLREPACLGNRDGMSCERQATLDPRFNLATETEVRT